MVPLHCPKLESTELRYHGYDANIPILQRLLLGISAPKNSINFTNMKYRFVMCWVNLRLHSSGIAWCVPYGTSNQRIFELLIMICCMNEVLCCLIRMSRRWLVLITCYKAGAIFCCAFFCFFSWKYAAVCAWQCVLIAYSYITCGTAALIYLTECK